MIGARAEPAEWVLEEFGGIELGDRRRTERVLEVVTRLAQRPAASFPAASGGDWASLKATYRLLDNPALSHQALLSGHVAATWERVQASGEAVVLAVQDTTELDFTRRRATTGLGQIGNEHGRGLVVHTTLASTVQGLALGLLAQEVWARSSAPRGLTKSQRKQRPIAEKESYKWLEGLHRVAAGRQQTGTPADLPQLVLVSDAESDLFEYFRARRPAGVGLLVRAAQDRLTGGATLVKLRTRLAAQPASAPEATAVPRHAGQPARTAQVVLRWQGVLLPPPRNRPALKDQPAVRLWAVWVSEVAAPAGVDALDWLLLTTVPVRTLAEAQERVAWYRVRWLVEVWHHILKSGCAFEQRQLASAEHLTRALALYDVIAWRILYGTHLARAAPAVPCTVLFELQEWQALCCAVHRTTTPPSSPPTLGQAMRWVAELGGCIGRTSDGPPGALVLWRGFVRLVDLTSMFTIFVPPPRPR